MMVIRVYAKTKDGRKEYFRGRGKGGTFEITDFPWQLNDLLFALGKKAKEKGMEVDWDLEGFK